MEHSAKSYTEMEGHEMVEACGANAMKWAIAFNQHAVKLGYSEMDEGWLVGWFANAIMHGHDTMMGAKPLVLDDGSSFFVAGVN